MRLTSYYVAAFVVVMALALGTRLWHIADFPYAVFDEVYYTTMATQYLEGRAFVDTHPPTARFIFAGLAWLGGAEASDRFEFPYTPYGDFPYTLLRGASAVAGVGLVALLMLVVYELSRSRLASVLTGWLAVWDTTLVIQSRYALADIFLFSFGMGGLWLWLRTSHWPRWSREWYIYLIGATVLFGLAIGVKVSGGLFPLVAVGYTVWRERGRVERLGRYVAIVLGLPVLILFLLMCAHFALLDHKGGVVAVIGTQKDAALRTVAVFDSVRAIPFEFYLGLWLGRGVQIAVEAMIGIILTFATHFFLMGEVEGSPWWAWPFMEHPFLLTITQEGSLYRVVEMLGNPLVWWGGIIALSVWLWRRLKYGLKAEADILVAGYGLNLLIMALLPRTLFLYHYFLSLIFLIPLTGIMLATLHERRPWLARLAIVTCVVVFIFFAPLTYGLPLTARQMSWRAWLPDWHPLTEVHLRYFPHIQVP